LQLAVYTLLMLLAVAVLYKKVVLKGRS
jgi:hypothetical protein